MTLAWTPVTPVAGQAVTLTAFGFDQNGAPMGNVTPGTTFTLTPDGSCVANVCTATVAGAHRVTAARGAVTASAIYIVLPGALSRLELAPSAATIPVGGSQAYTAQGFDQFGNTRGDHTATTVFTISPNGSCAGAVCSASIVGPHVVTGTDGAVSDTATLAVVPGALASITISPSEATVAAGQTQTYTAAGFDAGGNPLGDVTGGTIFTIAGIEPTDAAASCTDNQCGATAAGAYVVTGTNGTAVDTAALSVVPAAADSVVIAPGDSTGTAGEGQTFTATAFDSFGNEVADVTGDTVFAIDPVVEEVGTAAASCTANVCTATEAGNYLITATYQTIVATTPLTIVPAGLDAIEIAPSESTIDVGQTQSYTATGFDEFGNQIGDVTGDTLFTIEPAGGEVDTAATGCTANACGSDVAGDYVVTGTNGTTFDVATLVIQAGDVASIVVAPATATITAGGSQAYTAQGFDQFANPLGDVTGDTVFSIDGAGTCSGASCGSDYAGSYTVTGTLGTIVDTASLTVDPGAIDYLTISPESAQIASGGSQAYTTQAWDVFGNLIGTVTGDTVFTIELSGRFTTAENNEASCTGNVCTAYVAADHTVTGSYAGEFASSLLTVVGGALDSITISPSSSSITAGTTQTYTADGYDAANNWLGDVTGDTTFTISAGGSCTGAACGSTTAGGYTVTGTNGTAVDTASLTVTPAAAASLVLTPATASIQTGQTQAYAAEAFDAFGNSRGVVTGTTVFMITSPGTCSTNACGSNTAGSYTVTGTHAGAIGTAVLTVTTPPVDERIIRLRLTPAEASIPLGSSQQYTALGLDAHGNVIADVTTSTIFSIVPDGSCSGNTCTPGRIGEHTVHGAYGNKNATAKLIATAVQTDAAEPQEAPIPAPGQTTQGTQSGSTGTLPPAGVIPQITPPAPPAPRPVPQGIVIQPPVPQPQPSGGLGTPPAPRGIVPPAPAPTPKREGSGVLTGLAAEPISSRKRIVGTEPPRLQDCPIAPAGAGLASPDCDDDAS